MVEDVTDTCELLEANYSIKKDGVRPPRSLRAIRANVVAEKKGEVFRAEEK